MKIAVIALAAAAALAPSLASASYLTGNDMLNRLRSRESVVDRSMATGYAIGIYDAYSQVTHCPPDNVTVGQLVDMTIDWLERNAKTRHEPASTHLMVMLMTTWPCKKNGNT